MRVINLLVEIATRDEEVEGRLEGLLGIVEESVEAIPAGRPQSTGGIYEASKGHWHDFVGSIDEGQLIKHVLVGIIEILVITNTAAETADTAEIRFDVGAPLALGP